VNFTFLSKQKIAQLPKTPGVYALKKGKELLYIGKATNIRERVKNHFPSRSEGERRTNVLRTGQPAYRDYLFIDKVKKIGYIKTNSEIEALILEANLIKKYQPKYNVVWRDDKNYFFVGITTEDFPKVFITHQTKLKIENCKLKIDYVGPFVDGSALKQTLKVLRKVFPYRSCNKIPSRPCLWYQLNRCPAPCLLKSKVAKEINLEEKLKKECQKNAKNLVKILQGKKIQVLKSSKKEMKKAAISQDFEKATKIRDQIWALERIISHAKIFDWLEIDWRRTEEKLKKILKTRKKIKRIEAYDVSNIQGQLATGAMVTFIKGLAEKNFYRRFKIKMGGKPDDIAMIKEVLKRRFKHTEWPYPDLILIDDGIAQLNAAKLAINNYQLIIPIVALAKKENKLFIEGRKKPILLKNLLREIFNLILQLRDEAHRFAITYHKKLRVKDLIK